MYQLGKGGVAITLFSTAFITTSCGDQGSGEGPDAGARVETVLFDDTIRPLMTSDDEYVYFFQDVDNTSLDVLRRVSKTSREVTTVAEGIQTPVEDLVVDDESVCWSQPRIWRVAKGGGISTQVQPDIGVINAYRLGVSDAIYYNGTYSPWGIHRIPIEGGSADLIAQVPDKYDPFVVDGNWLYWATSSSITRASLDGMQEELLYETEGKGPPRGIATDATAVYALYAGTPTNNDNCDFGAVVGVSKDGSVSEVFADDVCEGLALAVDDEHVYWAENLGSDRRWIRRIPKVTGEAEILVDSAGTIRSMLVDDTHVYWTEVSGMRRIRK